MYKFTHMLCMHTCCQAGIARPLVGLQVGGPALGGMTTGDGAGTGLGWGSNVPGRGREDASSQFGGEQLPRLLGLVNMQLQVFDQEGRRLMRPASAPG